MADSIPSIQASPTSAKAVPRRLILLFDGTWNKREDSTNVWRMKLLIGSRESQLVYYDEGVGTKEGEEFEGGAFGKGVTRKALHGYLWLMEHYLDAADAPGGLADELYVFGFSRGAFTARSLVGVLAIAGLLHRGALARVKDAFNLSRVEGITESSVAARTFRQAHSREVKIKFLGVWDTVESLGFPQIQWPFARKRKPAEGPERPERPLRRFSPHHKVILLPSIVHHARHALAIDEHRWIFDAMLWPSSESGQTLEQRWFIGAHANVGGGYESDALFVRPLQWMAEEAVSQGLSLQGAIPALPPEFYLRGPRNSLDEVFYGAYYLSQLFRPWHRAISMGTATAETVDFTVLQRWLWDRRYRPPSLISHLPHVTARPSKADLEIAEIGHLLGKRVSHVSSTWGYQLKPDGDTQ